MSSDPRAFNAALYSFQLVVRYFFFADAIISLVYAALQFRCSGLIVQQSLVETKAIPQFHLIHAGGKVSSAIKQQRI